MSEDNSTTPPDTSSPTESWTESEVPKLRDRVRRLEVGSEIKRRIESGLLAVDLGGHFASGVDGENVLDPRIQKWIDDHIGTIGIFLEEDLARRIVDYFDGLTPTIEPPVGFRPSCLFSCPECDQDMQFTIDGPTLRAQPCPYPDGYPPIEFDLNVPSGKLVVANDLRDLFKVIDSFNINATHGVGSCTLAYAKVGLAHGFVGNTMPGVFAIPNKGEPTSFLIGNTARNAETMAGPHSRRGKRVATICTDLWWYSICDYAEFVERAGCTPEEYRRDCDVVTCKPGVYHFKQVHHLIKSQKDYDDTRKAQIYCLFNWVRDPDPEEDLDANYKALDFTAEEVIGDHVTRWEYDKRKGGEQPEAVLGAINHIMCVIGTGAEHHPNGWVGTTQEVDRSQAIEIPPIEQAFRWYPICGYSPIAEMVGMHRAPLGEDVHMNPSFVRLAFNVIRSMLAYGIETYPRDTPEQQVEERARQLHWAWHIYLGLQKRYPDQVPENCIGLPKPSVEDIDKRPS